MKLFVCAACLFIVFVSSAAGVELLQDERSISFQDGDKLVLTYWMEEQEAPEPASDLFDRSGFIHPLRTPGGAEMTGIFPDDHYHHMGLWHAWVKTSHNGRALDFWNVGQGIAGVRFSRLISTWEKPEEVGFEVEQEHFARRDDGTTEVVLREKLRVTLRKQDAAYLISYDTTQVNVSDAALALEAYRYGGPIAYRGPDSWDESNSTVLTSQGRGREDGHATRARWVAMTGPTDVGRSTLAILCHPSNRDAPQRVRIWEEGPMFFNYVPAQETPFEILPDEESVMRFQVVTFDGEPDLGLLEKLWHEYQETDYESR